MPFHSLTSSHLSPMTYFYMTTLTYKVSSSKTYYNTASNKKEYPLRSAYKLLVYTKEHKKTEDPYSPLFFRTAFRITQIKSFTAFVGEGE